jgi:hypothetical protein
MSKAFAVITLILLIIVGVGAKLIYGYEMEKVTLSKMVDGLKIEKESLKKSVEEGQKISIENKQKVTALTSSLNHAHVVASNALSELEKLKKPVVVTPIKDNSEVTKQIKTYYNDDTVAFFNEKFMIYKNTTYALVTDAVSWKINYPIFQTNLSKNSEAIAALEKEAQVKDALISQQSTSIADLDKNFKLQTSQVVNNQTMIDDLNKSLNLEKKRSSIEKVCYFIGGAAVMFTAVQVAK